MLHINNLTYRIAGRELFTDASVHVPAGHRIGVVGRNGVGKSTLLRLIAGDVQPDGGTIRLPKGLRMGEVDQEAPGGPDSLIDTVLAADRERLALLAELETSPAGERMAWIHERLVDIDAYSAPARAARILAGLGFDDDAQQAPCDSFSGGWRMRVALAAVLFLEPDLLLLDEPTNYLDIEGAFWLENFLRGYRHTVLLVSHDRDLLNRAVNGILHLEQNRFRLYHGIYDGFERQRRERLVLEEKARQKQEVQRKHIQNFVDRFRYQASKARQAQSRLKALERMQPVAAALEDPNVVFAIPAVKALAPPLIAADRAAVGYGDGPPVLQDLSFTIGADDRIALLGRNGNGKSTLAKLLAGRLPAMAGSIEISDKLTTAYFAQHQIEDLRAAETAVGHLRRLMPDKSETWLRNHLGAFGLSQKKSETASGDLSGGEKSRLVLALITVAAPHMLILDEPTNHLDVDARQALIQALNDYRGAVVLIGHDRHFVDLVADRLWLVANGTVTAYDGDLADYHRSQLRKSSGRPGPGKAPRGSSESAAQRRQRKRDAARDRNELKPLREKISRLEREIGELQNELRALAGAMMDPDSHGDDASRITELNKSHGQFSRKLEDKETLWLEVQAELESRQQSFAQRDESR